MKPYMKIPVHSCQHAASAERDRARTDDELLPWLQHRKREGRLDPEPLAPDHATETRRWGAEGQLEAEEHVAHGGDALPCVQRVLGRLLAREVVVGDDGHDSVVGGFDDEGEGPEAVGGG